MASKHMQRGRQSLRALERHEKEAKAASKQPKPQPESFGTVEAIDPEIEIEIEIEQMSNSSLGIALSNVRRKHLKNDGTRKLASYGKTDDFKRLQQLEVEWKKRLNTF